MFKPGSTDTRYVLSWREGNEAAANTVSNGNDHFEVRQLQVGEPDRERAFRQVLGAPPPPAGAAPIPQVVDLLVGVRRRARPIDLLFGVYLGDKLVGACLALESPGAAALVVISRELETPAKRRASVEALRALQTVAWRRSIALLEALVTPGSPVLGGIFHDAGFQYLTRLLYLRRSWTKPDQGRVPAADLEWIPYTPKSEPLFLEALERTYVQTLDCPELTDLRPTSDVLADHRATGIFDPDLWRVAMRGGEPVGVMLLNRIPTEPAFEVVYMGVAQTARGTGVADALLHWAVETVARVGDVEVALAVDANNVSARRLYARWGFVETGARDAWIAISPQTRGLATQKTGAKAYPQ